MPKLYQPLVSIGNDMGFACVLCDEPVRYLHAIYGTLNTGQYGYCSVERRDGSRVSCKYPICISGYFCVRCTSLGQSFKLQEPR